MTEFEKQVYRDMSSADRVAIYMVKALELKEFIALMTDADVRGLRWICDQIKKDAKTARKGGKKNVQR